MGDLQKLLVDYFMYCAKTLEFWKVVVGKTSTSLRPLCNQCEQLRLCHRTQLEEMFLKKFPCVKEKLCGKIQIGIEEEMRSICKVEEEMKSYVDGLKTRLNLVEKSYSKYSPEETEEFNALIPSFHSLMEHALDTWRCFQILWIGVKTAIETVDFLSKHSVDRISESFLKFEKLEPDLQYILDLTQYLRT